MRLLLDHHYWPGIAIALRAQGHDVVAAIERDWHALPDGSLLSASTQEQRCLLTNNVRDFIGIARHWAADERRHAGIVYTSDRGFPRDRASSGRLIRALADFLDEHAQVDVLIDQQRWL